jgi:uncharacterized membrane protein
MSWLSNIFSPDVVSKSVDAIINTGDVLVYTAEEKAQAYQKAVDTKLKMLQHFEPFKIAQRGLAFMFAINFLLSFWVGVAFYYFGTIEQLKGFLDLVGVFQLGWIMLAIISFYFGGGFISSMGIGKK